MNICRCYLWAKLVIDFLLSPLSSLSSWPSQDRALSYAQTHFWYLFKLLYPRYLSFDYGYACIPTIHTIWDWRNILPVLAYGSVAGLAAHALIHSRVALLVVRFFFELFPG